MLTRNALVVSAAIAARFTPAERRELIEAARVRARRGDQVSAEASAEAARWRERLGMSEREIVRLILGE